MNKKSVIVFLSISIFYGVCEGSFKMSDAGTTTAQFLKLGVGARAIGMGEAYISVADDPTAIYWNPAGLASVAEQEVSMMHALWFESVYFDFAAYAQPVGHYGVLGAGIQYLSSGEIDEYDNSGLHTGTFNPNDMAVSLAWAEDYNDLLIGIGIKYISMEIKNTADVIAADVGVMYPFLINDGKIGITVQNIGGKTKFDAVQESLPLIGKVGVSVHPVHGWLLSCDMAMPVDYNPYVCAGTEYTLGRWSDYGLSMRAGYTSHTLKSELGGVAGLTAGIGIILWDAAVDYAWAPYGDLGQTHRVSIGYKF